MKAKIYDKTLLNRKMNGTILIGKTITETENFFTFSTRSFPPVPIPPGATKATDSSEVEVAPEATKTAEASIVVGDDGPRGTRAGARL